jgi:hypothetical protein
MRAFCRLTQLPKMHQRFANRSYTTVRRIVLAVVFCAIGFGTASADVKAVWAIGDGDKVDRDDLAHPGRHRNGVWDGTGIRLFAARNEIVAFQVIVEADGRGIGALSVALPDLRFGPDAIVYRAPVADPSDTVDRPIQLFSVNYMQVTTPSRASWVWEPGSAAAPANAVGWKPVQLVPENARAGRGGFPVTVRASRNQAFWIEIYTGRDRPAGMYQGRLTVTADGRQRELPVSLELFDFALPDENTMHAMVYYGSDQPELYHGRNMDPAYHRFAHRQRIELVHAYDIATARAALGRFTGADFTREAHYDGPGQGVGNVIVPASFYGPGTDYDERASAWAHADAWMTFLRQSLPKALTFLYMPDEPRPPQYPRILQLAENVHSNPGPGRALPILVTHEYVDALAPAIDIWCSGPQRFQIERAQQERARGHDYWFYNGGRPAGGAITIDAPATDARATIWAGIKHDARVYFYWHAVHWRHNSQKQGERNQNVWAESITFDNRGQANKPTDDQGYIHGDGVLLYPGEDVLHPDQDRGISGPISTVQLANVRRGLQDQQYIALARSRGLTAMVNEVFHEIVPRVFSDAGTTVSFPERGDPYDAARLKLARAIAEGGRSMPASEIRRPVLFDTPEADRILSTLQVFPPDNPWHEDISTRPVHPQSTAMVASVGAEKPLGFNLDMNFVIVPASQPGVPVRITEYPDESDSGPFPIPENAPIENWPMARNEDAGALPKPGGTLGDLQRHGTGDRHLILVDPAHGRIHEFWQARLTDDGWEASQASTFDLTSNRLRPDRWTSADAAGLPIFPAIVRFDEVARGRVEHAMRFTVRRTRRAYVYPATHFASRSDDASLPRMGERFRLRRDFDVSGFPPHAQAILRGLQQYGMFVADNGGDWLTSIAPDRRFEGLESLARVKGSDFEAIVPTGPDEGPRRKR